MSEYRSGEQAEGNVQGGETNWEAIEALSKEELCVGGDASHCCNICQAILASREMLKLKTAAPTPEPPSQQAVPEDVLGTARALADRNNPRNSWLKYEVIKLAEFVVALAEATK